MKDMKRIILSALVFGALMSGRLAHASGRPGMPMEIPEKSTIVTFSDVNTGDKLVIRDSDGISLYSEKIKKDGAYTRKFNLSNLPENRYYFEVEKAGEITVLPFNVERETITLENALKTDIVKPQLVTQNDKVLLSRDVEGAQSMKVNIYYRGKELVHSDEIDKNGKLLRRYDFSNSRSGDYLFHIEYDNRTLEEYVSIR